jgi:hypothetical protein
MPFVQRGQVDRHHDWVGADCSHELGEQAGSVKLRSTLDTSSNRTALNRSDKVSPKDMFNDARYGCVNSAASSGEGNLSG